MCPYFVYCRRVLECTPHTLVVGRGAEELGREEPPLQAGGGGGGVGGGGVGGAGYASDCGPSAEGASAGAGYGASVGAMSGACAGSGGEGGVGCGNERGHSPYRRLEEETW